MELGEVYLVSGKRTPHAKAGLDLADVAAPFLGTYLLTYLLDSHAIPASAIDEVIIGNIGAPAKYANVSRVIALEAG
ncbi:MAG: acetyl-CoA C-acyltransferase, partial [Bdellovibrionales bacterium]|nr:acetyl-CoA C-acyltransferase [Bdellovibrionales bacterium]